MYQTRYTIRFHDTDAAGVIYFANLPRIAHCCYEEFLETKGLSIRQAMDEKRYRIPVVHSDADYFHPIRLGDHLDVELEVSRIGKSSFTVEYRFRNERGEEAARVHTVHVVVDGEQCTSREIPPPLREALTHHLKAGG